MQDFEFELEIWEQCRKAGCVFIKSGFWVVFGILIGKSGIACIIGKIPTKSGKLMACMAQEVQFAQTKNPNLAQGILWG